MSSMREMRVGGATVRIKSAGMLLVGGVIGVVGIAAIVFVAVRPMLQTDRIPTDMSKPLDTAKIRQQRASAMEIPLPAASQVTDRLQNADFEQEFHPVSKPISGQHSTVSGNIASGWLDLSQFADATVDYEQDTSRPQAGKSSQRIDVQSLQSGSGDIMFAQPIRLKEGNTYSADVWLRAAASDTPVIVSLRMRGKPYKYYASQMVKVGPDWKKVTITGKVTDHFYPYGYLMLELNQSGSTVWVDSVSVEKAG